MKNNSLKNDSMLGPLEHARRLELPSREAVLNRDPSVSAFWLKNQELLVNAWHEWEEVNGDQAGVLDESLLDKKLFKAINAAWSNPILETEVKKLWTKVSYGVYQCQFFDPDQLRYLRGYLTEVQAAEIPLRPPYGIALNRFGAMLDQRSEGYVATPKFQDFYSKLMDKYMRPVGRLLFPEITGFDTQTFGFSIQYEPGIDTSLQLHSDASAVTLNINLNLPGEKFTGSEVDFYDPITGNANRVSFEPGVAMIHRGAIAHAAQPITSGQRRNIVLWLYGDRMAVPSPRQSSESTLGAKDRWTVPSQTKDTFAPF